MFALAPVAGSKREADYLTDKDAQSPQAAGPGCENRNGIDPAVLCCDHCPVPCPETRNLHAAKRRASAQRVGEYHTLAAEPSLDADCQFPDDCFEKFCQECNLDSVCQSDCAVACPSPDCPDDNACFDPRCKQSEKHCDDGCVELHCSKLISPEKPCFCLKCQPQPCSLADPNYECYLAHSAPTSAGTIYCYDNAPCHFQEPYRRHGPGLVSFETYPCFSPAPNYNVTTQDDFHTIASSATTPALSHSNYNSLNSVFSGEPSPSPAQPTLANCFLDIAGDHCHIDNSCCHGPKRACGEMTCTSPQQLEVWNTSMAPVNGLANNFVAFGFNGSLPASPMSASRTSNSSTPFQLNNAMLGLNDHSWMMMDPSFPNTFPDQVSTNRLDYLASAIQQDMLRPSTKTTATVTTTTPTNPTVATTTSIPSGSAFGSGAPDVEGCVCKWQHSPGILCLAVFNTPESLHKHIKTTHVDNCIHCFCQWDSCEAFSKDFKQRSKLSRHLLGHAGYRPYACSYKDCNKTFATNQAKDNHERTHTGERPYVCDRCGYTTTTHTQLQTHISALHEGKKPHKCRFCQFTCADSSNLSKHERTHQTLRPYRCPHVNCTFKPDCRWENLKRHLRRSEHCPELLVETSKEYKSYRESVRREIDEWHKRNEDGGLGKAGRRRRISRV